jgi:hypothetical protein
MVGTFALVLLFTMLKDAYEDLKRYSTQKELNLKQAYVLNENKIKQSDAMFLKSHWEDIRAG